MTTTKRIKRIVSSEVKQVKCANPDCPKLYPSQANRLYCSHKCGAIVNRANLTARLGDQGAKPKLVMATGTVGATHELIVCADLMKSGYNVFRAQSPNCPCDLILLFGEKIFRVEVRTGTLGSRGQMHFPFRESDKGRFDILAVVRHNWEIIYHDANLNPIDIKAL